MKEYKHIVSFSGGKDSTAMLLMMIEKGIEIDEIIFLDTGAEFPQMYKHIKKVEKYINKKITVLRNRKGLFEYWLLNHIKTRGKFKGQKGYSWADHGARWCTATLKVQVSNSYLKEKYKDYQVILYQGIAFDEQERATRESGSKIGSIIKYPLVEWEITEKEALEYCYSKGFDFGGLYKNFDRVSCWCCPLKSLKELKVLWSEYPELWSKLKEWDSKTYRKFRADYSVEELEKKFEKEKRREECKVLQQQVLFL